MGILPEGGSVRILCPFCNGGSSKELSMNVYSRDGRVTYHCFRNKCKATGSLTGGVTHGKPRQGSKSYKIHATYLPQELRKHLPVQDTSTPIMWEPKLQLVLYPILDFHGVEIGYIRRHYKELNGWWKGSKALTVLHNPDSPVPTMHFPLLTSTNLTDTITLVEDWPSSEVVAKHTPCAALLGTSISDTEIGYLLSIGVRHVNICLDNDALATAARLKRKLALLFDSVSVTFVDQDPKDMDEKSLQKKFGG